MAEWRSEHKVAFAGAGVAVLTTLTQVFSDYMRKHVFYAYIAGFVAILMILAPSIHTLYLRLRKSKSEVNSPLEIIFDPLNPARRFWSLVSHVDDYQRLVGNFWEHRVEIRNNSSLTLRNVRVTVEHIGQLPILPVSPSFIRTKTESCDINPGCSELVLVNRWPNPKRQEGMLAGDTAWEYGPIKVIASADNTLPSEVIYEFNYDTEQMLFERGKY